jgi:hypothetical protein
MCRRISSSVGRGLTRNNVPARISMLGNAVAALRRLLFDEGLLDLIWLAVFEQTLKRRDLALAHRGYRQNARERSAPADVNQTCVTLPQTASKLGAVQRQLVPEDIEERGRRVRVDLM